MSVYFISDLHFGHSAVIRYSNRPFKDVNEMNEELIRRWNSKVRPEDTIYVLGDLSFLPYKEFVPIAGRLNGKKILIKGNHDSYSEGQYNKLGFVVYHELLIKFAGQRVRMSHYPYALPWYKRLFVYKSELRFMDRRPPKIKDEFLLHDHTHSKKKVTAGRMIHIGCDAWDFYPVSEAQLESLIGKVLKDESQ